MKMKKNSASIKVLSTGNRTSFQLNETTLIDAGSVVNVLKEKAAFIKKVYLTHSHLDHIVDIAFMLDDYFELRKDTLEIIGLEETIKAIKTNFLNDTIWPDFSKIKLLNSNQMTIKYKIIKPKDREVLSENETIEVFITDHTVKSCGYIYRYEHKSIIIATDTYSLNEIIKIIELRTNIQNVVLECSFPNSMQKVAKDSKHLTPELLFRQLKSCKRDDFQLYINHVKPTYRKIIKDEIEQYRGEREVFLIKEKEILHFF